MYITAKLVFRSYMPDFLEKGMLFVTQQRDNVFGKIYEYLQVHELTHIPKERSEYIETHGWPVRPYIVAIMINPDDESHVLAPPETIGWFDAGDDADDLIDIDLKIVNYILEDYNGELLLEVWEDMDENSKFVPTLFDYKVTIRLADDYPYEEDEETNILDYD